MTHKFTVPWKLTSDVRVIVDGCVHLERAQFILNFDENSVELVERYPSGTRFDVMRPSCSDYFYAAGDRHEPIGE